MSTSSTASAGAQLAQDVAALFSVHPTTVRRWRRAGLFPNAYRRDLRTWLYPDPDIEATRARLFPHLAEETR